MCVRVCACVCVWGGGGGCVGVLGDKDSVQHSGKLRQNCGARGFVQF